MRFWSLGFWCSVLTFGGGRGETSLVDEGGMEVE